MEILRPGGSARRTVGMAEKNRVNRHPAPLAFRQSTENLVERRAVLLVFLRQHQDALSAGTADGACVFCICGPDNQSGAKRQRTWEDVDQLGGTVSDYNTIRGDAPPTFDGSLETDTVRIGIMLDERGSRGQDPDGLVRGSQGIDACTE